MLKQIYMINQNMIHPIEINSGAFTFSYMMRRKPEQSHTEDSAAIFVIAENIAVIAIADGFGGQNSGEIASKIAIETVGRNIANTKLQVPLREKISKSFEEANRAILDLSNGAATTLVVAEIDHDHIRFYNAGDSVGFLLGGRGKQKLATIPHNPVGFGKESGLVDGNEDQLEEVKHIVSNYLGSEELRIEITAQKAMASRDRIVLASDGITDNLDLASIGLEPPLAMCTSIYEQATTKMSLDMGKPDDLALIIASSKYA